MNPLTTFSARRRALFLSLSVTGMCLSTTGCTGFGQKEAMDRPSTAKIHEKEESLWSKLSWAKDRDSAPKPYPNPTKLAATWTPDTLTQTGRTPTRGFGGRLFFFNEKSHAVPVNGTLVVHGFDERAKTEANRVKRYEFTPEQFTRHYGQSDLGASYSVWIPWDAVGGDQQEISLVASFVTEEGKTVQSAPAKVLLPGTSPEKSESLAGRFSPQYQEWKFARSSGRAGLSGLSTTTIARTRTQRSNRSSNGDVKGNGGAMVAISDTTPSGEIHMKSQPRRTPTILPASATLPSR